MTDPAALLAQYNKYFTEGEKLEQQGTYPKAIEFYTRAINSITEPGQPMNPVARVCYCNRSRCYLRMGDYEGALKDAEAALQDDKLYVKGILAKAEALYFKGDFEFALVFFHRGYKLRPEVEEFRLGIQKSTEAINNAIGSPDQCKLECSPEISDYFQRDISSSKNFDGTKKNAFRRQNTARNKAQNQPPPGSDRTVKQLLGELYADKQFLESLMQDNTLQTNNKNNEIQDLVSGGLKYLDKRADFWRQQKPMYARINEQKNRTLKSTSRPTSSVKNADISAYVRTLEDIENALEEGNPSTANKLAEDLLRTVQATEFREKSKILASIYSSLGSAAFDSDKLNDALEYHQKDLKTSTETKDNDGIDRALGNVGKVYARQELFQKAIDTWLQKVPICKSSVASAWVYHEIGRCYLQLDNANNALEYGQKSNACALEAQDSSWNLNSLILIAQAYVAQSNYPESITTYEKALSVAEKSGNESVLAAIRIEIEEVKANSIKLQDSSLDVEA